MKICKISDCENKYYAKEYCHKHYQKFRRCNEFICAKIEMHGMSNTSEYDTWVNIIQRCFNKKNISYKYYGGHGIIVCSKWLKSYLAFYKDMGPKPFPKAQIDRTNNAGNYEPSNCVWSTRVENMRHTSRTKITVEKAKTIKRIYKAGGISQKKLASIYRIDQSAISRIINHKRWRQYIA